ncbi:MAG: NRDE family protein [Pseudomonadales bacterium]|nr:NRDE family protein [Pseudomonadales bacterium]
MIVIRLSVLSSFKVKPAMCLIFIALNQHPEFPLIVAANRDEFFSRPTAPMEIWQSSNGKILAGKDLQAGGTWLGYSHSQRFSALTNYRDPLHEVPDPISRGHLVADFLNAQQSCHDFLTNIEANQARYQGFNLIVGDHQRFFYFSNRSNQGIVELQAGIHGLSNHLLDTPWPKVAEGKSTLQQLLQNRKMSAAELAAKLLELLNHRQQAPDHLLPDTGVGIDAERILSSRFISPNELEPQQAYGTRCSTIIIRDRNNCTHLWEQTWDARGEAADKVSFQLNS